MQKRSGLLMPIFSLPGPFGCGDFGKGAYEFVDMLAECNFSVWQILPIGILDEFNSPYMPKASFAGNPDYIDLQALYEQGLLTEEELQDAKQKSPYQINNDILGEVRLSLLRKAYSRMQNKAAVNAFMDNNPHLKGTVEFLALKDQNSQKPWQEWTVLSPDKELVSFYEFLQYKFYTQWYALKAYANKKGILIMGDIPFYVAEDSADVYCNKDIFLLDSKGYSASIAGVPPDYFSENGQLWGNPIYDWKKMQEDDFSWWRKRIEHAASLYDMVRLDHFRAFSDYWAVPKDAPTAASGKWVTGPREKVIDAIKDAAKNIILIAENLGTLDEGADNLLKYADFPGMGVFQFGFDGNYQNVHLPHNYTSNTVAYTGTHDNNTLLGFIWEISEQTREQVFNYAGFGSNWEESMENIMKCLLRSNAGYVIFPIQDILGFGSDTRINTPGTTQNNWKFRITGENIRNINTRKWKELNKIYSRN